jgi:DNA-binding XRE family transcriptional regulator
MEAVNSIKGSNTSAKNAAYSVPVKRAIEKVGHDLALARRRRRFSQASMAERIGISVATRCAA